MNHRPDCPSGRTNEALAHEIAEDEQARAIYLTLFDAHGSFQKHREADQARFERAVGRLVDMGYPREVAQAYLIASLQLTAGGAKDH